MDQANTEKLISKLISGTYEEFCKNIVVFLEIVSIHFEILLYLLRNIIYVFLIKTDISIKLAILEEILFH